MNGAHQHLLLVHFPIAGLILACPALLYAAISKNSGVRRAALLFLVVVSASAFPANFTGHRAEEIVEELQGISPQEVSVHEKAAELAYWAAGVSGALALGLLIVFRKKDPPAAALWGALLVTVIAASFVGRAANLGGKIRHPEIELSPREHHGPPPWSHKEE